MFLAYSLVGVPKQRGPLADLFLFRPFYSTKERVQCIFQSVTDTCSDIFLD